MPNANAAVTMKLKDQRKAVGIFFGMAEANRTSIAIGPNAIIGNCRKWNVQLGRR